VLRKWKAFMEPKRKKSDKPTLRDSVANPSKEAAAKDRRIAELEAKLQEATAARETGAVGPSTVADAIAALIAAAEVRPSQRFS
jgi:hypothetical protein